MTSVPFPGDQPPPNNPSRSPSMYSQPDHLMDDTPNVQQNDSDLPQKIYFKPAPRSSPKKQATAAKAHRPAHNSIVPVSTQSTLLLEGRSWNIEVQDLSQQSKTGRLFDDVIPAKKCVSWSPEQRVPSLGDSFNGSREGSELFNTRRTTFQYQKLRPPPLSLHKEDPELRPSSRFSMSSDESEEEVSETIPRVSFLSQFRKSTSFNGPQSCDGTYVNRSRLRKKRGSCFYPSRLAKRIKVDHKSSDHDPGTRHRFSIQHLSRSRQGAASSPIPPGLSILTNSSRRYDGPATPYPSTIAQKKPRNSPTPISALKSRFSVSNILSMIEQAVSCRRDTAADRRREKLKEHISVIRYPEPVGQDSTWL